jgi:hypothetical protein
MTFLSSSKRVNNNHYTDDPYLLTVVTMDISNLETIDIYEYFYKIKYKPLEKDLDPMYDEMHFYRFIPKAGVNIEKTFYLVKTIPKTNEWGVRKLYIYSIQTYCDIDGAIFETR